MIQFYYVDTNQMMGLPNEIKQIIYMYALPSIFKTYPNLYSEMKVAISKRHTYAHRVYRCKQIAKMYINYHTKQKIKNIKTQSNVNI